MEKYLEIKEELTKEEKTEKLQEFIRVEVADEAETRAKIKELKPLLKGKKKACLHEHNHIDSSKNRPCNLKELK